MNVQNQLPEQKLMFVACDRIRQSWVSGHGRKRPACTVGVDPLESRPRLHGFGTHSAGFRVPFEADLWGGIFDKPLWSHDTGA
jgi:hypothetical protein